MAIHDQNTTSTGLSVTEIATRRERHRGQWLRSVEGTARTLSHLRSRSPRHPVNGSK
jgi:hypothetical protein